MSYDTFMALPDSRFRDRQRSLWSSAMNLPLDTVLCLLAAGPAGICLAQGKDGPTKAWCAALLVLAVVIGLSPFIDPFKDLLNRPYIYKGSAVAVAIVAIVCAVRIADGMFAALMVTGTLLLALLRLGLVSRAAA